MPEYRSIGTTPITRELMPFARDFAKKQGLEVVHPFYEHGTEVLKILEVECACGSIIIVMAKKTLDQETKYVVEFIEASMRASIDSQEPEEWGE